MRRYQWGLLAGIALVMTACGTHAVQPIPTNGPVVTVPPPIAVGSSGVDVRFPTDGVQPWERLDTAGHVIPAKQSRASSTALGPNSEFQTGSQRFLEGGGFSDLGAATKLTSPAGGTVAYAMYRFSLGAAQPGVVTVDANLHGAGAQYYVAVANYQLKRWHWQGPFGEAQVALTLPAGDATSTLGNTFVAVAAFDGAEVDVVGVGVTARDGTDATPPPSPAAPVATPVAGGIELAWVPVVAADLAGYRVYYSSSPFIAPGGLGVKSLGWLEGTTRLILPAAPGRVTYVALSAVDVSGNASALSPTAFAVPTAGALPAVQLTTSIVSGRLNDIATLTATGASSYDFDLDGNGVFEVTGDTTGTATVDTSQTGLIRPRVRGTGGGGTAVAMGAVSLLISGNQPPVASITTSDRTTGAGPLPVTLSGADSTDFDGTITEWAWDTTSDGIFDSVSTTAPAISADYAAPDVYPVKLRVTDDDGAWDVDSITIEAQEGKLELGYETSVHLGETLEITAAYKGWETVTQVEWDFQNDGTVDATLAVGEPLDFYANYPGTHQVSAKATLSTGATAMGLATLHIDGWAITSRVGPADGAYYVSGALYAGCPAMCYMDGSFRMMFTVADSPAAQSWQGPIQLVPADTPYKCSMVTLADGSVGIAYTDSTDLDLCYVHMPLTGVPAPPVTLENNGITTDQISLAVINGNPAVAYYHGGLTDPLFIRAADAAGASWDAAVVIENLPADDGQRISLAEINGRPAVVYVSGAEIRYARAGDADGTAWQPSSHLVGLGDADDLMPLALASVNGQPALAWTENVGSAGSLSYLRANDADGIDWVGGIYATIDAKPTALCAPALAVVSGLPVITYSDIDTQLLAQSNTPNGNGWTTQRVMSAGLAFFDQTSALFGCNGNICVAQGDSFISSLSFGILYP